MKPFNNDSWRMRSYHRRVDRRERRLTVILLSILVLSILALLDAVERAGGWAAILWYLP